MCIGDTDSDSWRYGIEITSRFDSGSPMTLTVRTGCLCHSSDSVSTWSIGGRLSHPGVAAVVELLTGAWLVSGQRRLNRALHLLDTAGILTREPPLRDGPLHYADGAAAQLPLDLSLE